MAETSTAEVVLGLVLAGWFFWWPLYGKDSMTWTLAGPFPSAADCGREAALYQGARGCFQAETREQFDPHFPRAR